MDAAAIAEANKVREAMGLPPLPVPGNAAGSTQPSNGAAEEEEDTTSTLERRSAAAGSNWAKLEAERLDRIERQKRKEATMKARDSAAKLAKSEGKGLGDLDGDEQDTKSWLMGQKKRQKQIEKAQKAEEEKAARAKAAQAQYTAKDLKGLKVAHDMDGFDNGEQILTLKDAEIGDEDDSGDDELENAELVEKERLDERLKSKKKNAVYDPNEINDSGEQSILAHYDEEISGKKRKRFTLDSKGRGERSTAAEDKSASNGRGIKISLEALMDDSPVNDYADARPAKIRKPKKAKKERKARTRDADEDDIPIMTPQYQNGDTDMNLNAATHGGHNGTSRAQEVEVDDEDLQMQLATQRRAALKKRKKMDAAELARQMREEAEASAQDDNDEEEPGLVIDETREFVAHLKRVESDSEGEEARARRRQKGEARDGSPRADSDDDIPMAEVEAAEGYRQGSASPVPEDTGFGTSTGLADEETTSSMAAVAAMLRDRQHISSNAQTDAAKRSEHERRYADFLAANKVLIAEFDAKARTDREKDRNSGAFTSMSKVQQQEYSQRENEKREAYLATLQARHFAANYRPEVKLSYTDEHGRSMGQKEAFKHLSHMFHGKGSGKGKLEKRAKKIEDEKRREARALLDQADGHGMGGVMREQERKRGQAGVRLQ